MPSTTGPATVTAVTPRLGAADTREIASPALDRFTRGLHADRPMLDDYLMYVPDPPAADPDRTAH